MEPTHPFANQQNDKIAGIISYFTLIGWIIAYLGFHINNKTSLGSYQLRQTLLFHLVSMALRFGISFILGLIAFSTGFFSIYTLMDIVYLGLFIIWLIGLIGAINGEKRPIPLLGDAAQRMFPTI